MRSPVRSRQETGRFFGLKVIFPCGRVVLQSAFSFGTLARWSRGMILA